MATPSTASLVGLVDPAIGERPSDDLPTLDLKNTAKEVSNLLVVPKSEEVSDVRKIIWFNVFKW